MRYRDLAFAILTTVLCCLPFGVVSIVYAAQVDGRWNVGDVAGAEDASKKAKNWAVASLVCGLAVAVVYVLAATSSR